MKAAKERTQIFTMTKTIRQNGFTLLELLAVAAMVALLFSLGIASYARTFQRWAVQQNARQMYLAARSARLYAVEHQQPCTLVLDRENGAFFLTADETQDDGTEQQMLVSTPWSRKVELHDNVAFETVKIAGRYEEISGGVIFRPDGTSNDAVIQLGNGKTHYTITVSAGSGRPRLVEGEAENLRTDQIDLDLMDTA